MPVEEPVIEEPVAEETATEPNLDQEILDELKIINQNTNDSFAEDLVFNANFETFKTGIEASNLSIETQLIAQSENGDMLLAELQLMNERIDNLEKSSEYQTGQSHIFITIALTVLFVGVLYKMIKKFIV